MPFPWAAGTRPTGTATGGCLAAGGSGGHVGELHGSVQVSEAFLCRRKQIQDTNRYKSPVCAARLQSPCFSWNKRHQEQSLEILVGRLQLSQNAFYRCTGACSACGTRKANIVLHFLFPLVFSDAREDLRGRLLLVIFPKVILYWSSVFFSLTLRQFDWSYIF